MNAAHKYMDRDWLRGLTGAELLLLRLRYGKSVSAAVDAELNRRSHAAYGDLPIVPHVEVSTAGKRKRARRSTAAA